LLEGCGRTIIEYFVASAEDAHHILYELVYSIPETIACVPIHRNGLIPGYMKANGITGKAPPGSLIT
jgi:hypothetical protein